MTAIMERFKKPAKPAAIRKRTDHGPYKAEFDKLHELFRRKADVEARIEHAFTVTGGSSPEAVHLRRQAEALLDGKEICEVSPDLDVRAMQQELQILERAIALQEGRVNIAAGAAGDMIRESVAGEHRALVRDVAEALKSLQAAAKRMTEFRDEMAQEALQFVGPLREVYLPVGRMTAKEFCDGVDVWLKTVGDYIAESAE